MVRIQMVAGKDRQRQTSETDYEDEDDDEDDGGQAFRIPRSGRLDTTVAAG
jgi:hypothetical protein